ncbi:stonin-1 [Lepisosteus oculatus]|uniref:stonin-1 n=1 Tax=Lepisosteus oculatus TaxID=7918 RepID=UPI0035F5038C
MCSMNHPNWVTFEDDSSAFQSPQKSFPSPSTSTATPKPNGLKLSLPPLHDPASFHLSNTSPLTSPQLHFNGSPCVPSNTPLCTPVRETPGFFGSFSSGGTPLPSPALDSSWGTPQFRGPQCPFPPGGPSPFPAFQNYSGHTNPFWGEGRESGSSSSDSEPSSADTSIPRFFVRKDGHELPGDQIQQSYTYICKKLERLRAEDEGSGSTAPAQRYEQSKVRSSFIPQGLFRSQRRDGWSLMLRIPEKKNRMSSRQWGPIYLKLLLGGVLQMYYEKGLEKPFKEFQLHPYCRLSQPKLESYNDPGKIHTVKIEHVSYTERRKYHPKNEVVHEAEVEQLLKFGTTDYSDFTDLLATMEEELMQLPPHSQQKKHYEEQELFLQITDNFWGRIDKDGRMVEQAAVTHIYCLAFVNGGAECFLALNDLQLLRRDPSYGGEDSESWMEISDYFFHKSINESEFKRSRLIKFTPPDACRVELMRFKTLSTMVELPFSVKAVVTVQGAYIELQAFLNMSSTLTSSVHLDSMQVCENVFIQVSVPGDWIKVSRTVALLRQKSLKSRMNRNACLGSVTTADTEPVMQVTVGTVKYEHAYGSIVWRIERLPAKNTAADHPHCFSCKLELGSDQEIPSDWYPFVTMEFDVADTVVSRTRVKSLGIESDIQPQKHIVSKAHFHCQPKLYKSIIEDVIEGVRELFVDEGVEEQVLQDLRQMWESKVMQSKAVEGFVKDTINPSNFLLQLPASFAQTLQKPTASIVIPAGQNVQNFTADMNNSGSAATLSLPQGVSYPIQIPAGVTLQTSSGHLYKVNVPVMVTRAPGGQRILQQSVQHLLEQREAPEAQAAAPQTASVQIQSAVMQSLPEQRKDLFQQGPSGQLLQQQLVMGQCVQSIQPPVQQPLVIQPGVAVSQILLQHSDSLSDGQTSGDTPQIDVSQASSVQQAFPAQLGSFQVKPDSHLLSADVVRNNEDPGVVAEKPEKSECSNVKQMNLQCQPEVSAQPGINVTKDYNYNDIIDIVQIDGTCDSSSDEGAGTLREVGENEFLGIIDAEDLKVLEGGGGTSTSDSSTSDTDDDPPLEEVEEDPLNSGDDVSEQDVPDLFDTDNVIVCQYDKIHRSKNRWKFYLKDGVMSFGGKDYAFSKAIGEAEW